MKYSVVFFQKRGVKRKMDSSDVTLKRYYYCAHAADMKKCIVHHRMQGIPKVGLLVLSFAIVGSFATEALAANGDFPLS